MNLEKVIFGAFVILACTLNFGFFIGDLGNRAATDLDRSLVAANGA
jgi:hypothetical protein